MKRRPPSVRACSLRGKLLAKTKSDRAGKLLAECAATPKRSKRMSRKGGATKTACRRRGLALKSGKVGNSNISMVAVRLGECRGPAKKRVTAKKRTPVRRNPASDLSPEERAALRAFASRNGRTWKAALRQTWAYDTSLSGPLRALRNRLGPRWLASFTLAR